MKLLLLQACLDFGFDNKDQVGRIDHPVRFATGFPERFGPNPAEIVLTLDDDVPAHLAESAG